MGSSVIGLDLGLPQTADRELRTRFRRECRCMSALYERCLHAELDGVRSIAVACVDAPGAEVREEDGALGVEVRFDLAAYEAADDAARRRLAIAALHAGALRVADARGWDRAPFEAALAEVVARGHVNEWTLGKPRQAQDRRHFVTLTCAHEPDRFRAWLVVTDLQRREVARVLALDTPPSDIAFAPKLGRLAWTSNDSAVLFAHDGSVVKKVTVPRPARGA